MEERLITCSDGSRWRVTAPGRSSWYRIELVFESLEGAGTALRGEAAAPNLAELTDPELCFLLRELREQG